MMRCVRRAKVNIHAGALASMSLQSSQPWSRVEVRFTILQAVALVNRGHCGAKCVVIPVARLFEHFHGCHDKQGRLPKIIFQLAYTLFERLDVVSLSSGVSTIPVSSVKRSSS